jgi:hypothetical protein
MSYICYMDLTHDSGGRDQRIRLYIYKPHDHSVFIQLLLEDLYARSLD